MPGLYCHNGLCTFLTLGLGSEVGVGVLLSVVARANVLPSPLLRFAETVAHHVSALLLTWS